ncbi:MAG: DEAD/DEAH box helicase [Bacilli bacterium]
MKFEDFGLLEPIMKAIIESGYTVPTPIQESAIPVILSGKDILGCARTGTGKTAAFALPIINRLLSDKETDKEVKIRVLIMTPTRELAIQIRDNFREFSKYTTLKCSVIFGGVNQQSQINVLKKGVDILVATPGRLLDLINQKYVKLGSVKYLVLDEADTMLDMGFLHDVKKIMNLVPTPRQTLLFSATFEPSIEELAATFMNKPEIIKVTPTSSTIDAIEQSLYYVDKNNKSNLLIDILKKEQIKSSLIFTRTKHGANKLGETLNKAGILCGIIHGNKSQGARVKALKDFKEGTTKVLIATDIAARGIDIQELSHVFNYEMPEKPETYVHRIGRTGRANSSGKAISFANYDEKVMVKDIESLIKMHIPVIENKDYPMVNLVLSPKKQDSRGKKNTTAKPFNNRKSSGSYVPSKFASTRKSNANYGGNSFHRGHQSNRGK